MATAPPPAVLDAVRRLVESAARPVVLIDGGAGSGKTTLARRLVRHWPGSGAVQSVSLDDLYPGWSGLAAGSAAVPALVKGNGYRSWDWQASQPGGWRALDPSAALVVEGCGALTPTSREVAGLCIWVELDPARRRRRALARDGATFAAHWEEWARQEAEHWRKHRPWELADVVVGGAAPGFPPVTPMPHNG